MQQWYIAPREGGGGGGMLPEIFQLQVNEVPANLVSVLRRGVISHGRHPPHTKKKKKKKNPLHIG